MTVRILIIEDHSANLELMRYLLRAAGYEPLTARDGAAGLEMARRERPDLILCDVQLPKLDGYEVVRQLKTDRQYAHLQVVAVTALAMVGDKEKMLAAGFDGYLSKPIAPRTFTAQVEKFLPRGLATPHASADQPSPPPASARLAATPDMPSKSSRAAVLVVDDSAVNRKLLEETLRPLGYEVITAHNVDDALAHARQSPPDLIVSDLHMRGGDGFDLLTATRAEPRLSHIPVIVLSATVWDTRDGEHALALGATRFFKRPADPKLLLAEIERVLKQRAATSSHGHNPHR